jgi:nicotinamidase-related amidase
MNHPIVNEHGIALLLIDVINHMEFECGHKLIRYALPMARNIARLKTETKKQGIPCVYVNDNFGQWRSDLRQQVAQCLEKTVRGSPVAHELAPQHDDYFILKPKHSGFYQTPLEILLQNLKITKLILCGLTTDSCVLFTANDGYLRGFEILIPSDCCAAITKQRHIDALAQMRKTLKARTTASAQISFF